MFAVTHTDRSTKDDGYPTVLLAKKQAGLPSSDKAQFEGLYGRIFIMYQRIDKTLVEEFKSDIIVTTGGLFGEVPSLILNVGEQQAEEAFVWWKDTMGPNFYAEINRHGLEERTSRKRGAFALLCQARCGIHRGQQLLLHLQKSKQRRMIFCCA